MNWLESQWQSFLPKKRERQKVFPFSQQQDWNRKPDSYIPDQWKADWGRDAIDTPYSYDNLYHVTTNLSGVRAAKGLKSRAQLGIVGLGGGPENESPHLVSTTHSYSRALEIYHAIKYVTQIIQGRIRASQVLKHLMDGSNEDAIVKALRMYIPRRYLVEDGWDQDAINKILDSKLKTSKQVYEFMQVLERAITAYELDGIEASPLTVIGFTASYEDMVKINPSEVAILQVVARKGAETEHKPDEEELRFNPEDLKVVRFLQPV